MSAALCDQPNPAAFVEIPGKCNHILVDGSRLCRRKAGQKTEHEGYGCCWLHGGRQESHNKAARQLALEDAVLRLAGPDPTPVQDPALELSRLAGVARAWEAAARQKVDQFEIDGQLFEGDDVHPAVKLSERAQDRLRVTLVEMAKLGFAERAIQIDETVAAAVVAKVLETFVELGQDPAPYVALLAPKLAALDAVAISGAEHER